MCQRWSGGLFLCFQAQAEAVSVEGKVTRYPSSHFAERAFCPRCGSHLWMRDTTTPDSPYELMPGLFDEARDWPLRSEIYTDRAFASVRLEGDHPRATASEYEAKNPHLEGDGI
ncbi:MAG: GFA family protein [Alphaproteobacteria bacterium]|nr:MAG: GFA family protein [Alphaproteobacteria bacterium]